MKKLVKALTAIGTAALAVAGGVYVFRKFFAKDEELDEAFDDEELFGEETDEDAVEAFDDESEIFEDEAEAPAKEEAAEEAAPAEEAAEETAPTEEAAAPEETPESVEEKEF